MRKEDAELLKKVGQRGDLWMIKYLLLEAILQHEHNQDMTWLRRFDNKQAIYKRLEVIWERNK